MTHILAFLCLTLTLTPGYTKRVIDGDTYALYAIRIPAEEQVRILDIDTPERGAPLFAEATAFTATWLARGQYTYKSCRRDNFGRNLGIVNREADTLANALRAAGYGTQAAATINRSTALERRR